MDVKKRIEKRKIGLKRLLRQGILRRKIRTQQRRDKMSLARMGPSAWGHGSQIKTVYRYQSNNQRQLGNNHCTPTPGSLLLCVRHSGDGFYDYVPLDDLGDFVQGLPDDKIGAYAFREPEFEVSDRTFHLLQAGERVPKSDLYSIEYPSTQHDKA